MTQTVDYDVAVLDAIWKAVDTAAAGRVFGTPIVHNGLMVLPVAKVSGGGAGGMGTEPAGDRSEATGSGGGLGITARALGVYVIKDDKVSWRPAVDLNKVILGAQLVAVTALLVARAVSKARAGRRADE